MKFKMSLIPYNVDTSWIGPTPFDIKVCLGGPGCEHGMFLEQASKVNLQ